MERHNTAHTLSHSGKQGDGFTDVILTGETVKEIVDGIETSRGATIVPIPLISK